MNIRTITPVGSHKLGVVLDDGRKGLFDVAPYLDDEVFAPLKTPEQFQRVRNGGYYVEWESGADLSADTIEAGMVASA
ncbi:MAG: DUF2442 domain-containing protein [Opitutaceae bacterium]|jgi:hypothetical protein|nr:DUF2442 domain-containing protein [Opitutaceae bacterium]